MEGHYRNTEALDTGGRLRQGEGRGGYRGERRMMGKAECGGTLGERVGK